MPLPRKFYHQNTLTVARELLGKKLVRKHRSTVTTGIIVETEAYIGEKDSACHASRGLTPRTQVMFGPPGHAYIYLVYGMHDMLNIVTESAGTPAAVLIRAIEPLEGLTLMEKRRKQKGNLLSNGPAKLCQALAINRSLNNWDLTQTGKLTLEQGSLVKNLKICSGSRIGISYANPKDQIAPWRFWLEGNPYVSKT